MAQLSFQPHPLSVMIVDDEYMIVKGLERLIRWEELGLQLAGTAGNGQEALDNEPSSRGYCHHRCQYA